MKVFVSRGEWFDKDTEAILIGEPWQTHTGAWVGLFSGIALGKPDEEVCSFEEFDTIWREEAVE